MKINPKNERLKRSYFEYLKEAKKYSELTIDNIRKSILRWEEFVNFRDFSITKQQAIDFKKTLSASKGKRSGQTLSLSTMNSTLNNLKDFFKWLAYQRGYSAFLHALLD